VPTTAALGFGPDFPGSRTVAVTSSRVVPPTRYPPGPCRFRDGRSGERSRRV